MTKVIPYRRRKASPSPWMRASDYGALPSRKPGMAFAALLIACFLATFTAVFLWGGVGARPQASTGIEPVAIASAPDAETLRRQRWPNTAADLERAQPDAMAPSAVRDAGPGAAVSASFARCGFGSRAACVVDGDTIWLAGTKIRMADFNTPEVSQPGCAYERQLGERATARLLALLNSGAVTVGPNPEGRAYDKYGRALRIVRVDGTSVGDTLVAEGLAEPWRGYRRNWC